MISDKILKTSFLLSFLTHLLIFVLISPKVNVGQIPHYLFPKVDFISISLEKLGLKENLPDLDEMDCVYNFFKRKTAILDILPNSVGLKQIEAEQSLEYVLIEPSLDKLEFSLPGYENMEITGALRKRMLVFKPDEPKIPVWIEEEITGSLEVEIAADEKGDVVLCRRIISTGSYVLDAAGMDYARNFKFAPSEQHGLIEYGSIKVSFKK